MSVVDTVRRLRLTASGEPRHKAMVDPIAPAPMRLIRATAAEPIRLIRSIT